MTHNTINPGDRLRDARLLAGLTQRQLARESGVSYATIQGIEQATGAQPRLSTLRKLAGALSVTTSSLMSPERPEAPDPAPAERWDDVHSALYRRERQAAGTEVTEDRVLASLSAVLPDLAGNRYARIRPVLPGLIRDAAALGTEGRLARSRVLNTTAWLLTQTRQFDGAETAARLAREAAPDMLDEAAAVNTQAWALLRQGKLAEAAVLAERWADDIEPRRFSRASSADLAAWGKILLYVANAAIRDGRPEAADDAMSLARAAAARIGREVALDASTTRTFGPSKVAMIRVESAVLAGHPDRALAMADGLTAGRTLYAGSASHRRHRLDVAAAHAALRQYGEAVTVMQELRAQAPEWLAQQRYARDVLTDILRKRRRLTPAMRHLAGAVRLPLLPAEQRSPRTEIGLPAGAASNSHCCLKITARNVSRYRLLTAARGMRMDAGTGGNAADPVLDTLRFAWGDFYEFGFDQRGYWGRRHDGKGQDMVSHEPQGLAEKVSADFAFAPPAPCPRPPASPPPSLPAVPYPRVPFGARR